jgi:hypothetical protein
MRSRCSEIVDSASLTVGERLLKTPSHRGQRLFKFLKPWQIAKMEPNAPTQLNADEFASLRKLSLTPSMLDIPHVFTFRDGKIAFKNSFTKQRSQV